MHLFSTEDTENTNIEVSSMGCERSFWLNRWTLKL